MINIPFIRSQLEDQEDQESLRPMGNLVWLESMF